MGFVPLRPPAGLVTFAAMSTRPETALPKPAVRAGGRPRLRVLGTAATLIEPLRRQAQKDLGIDLEFIVLDGVSAQQRAALQPSSYDVWDQWFHNVDIVWSSGALQAIRVNRLENWSQLLREDLAIGVRALYGGPGDTPQESLYVQADLRLGATPTDRIGVLPSVYNVDSFGYVPEALPRELVGAEESWGWILDDRLRGKVALIADPSIGVADAAMAANALGLTRFGDVGRLTIDEIDELMRLLIRKKRAGHFAALWHSAEEARALMAEGQVAIESMWSPTLSELRAGGFKLSYAQPREGYRAWHGCLGLSSHLRGQGLDVAYAFLNWWLSGWPGALMARQGYYFSLRSPVQPHLSPAEWAYWYLGEPAREDLMGPDGRMAVPAGSVRDGGAYWQRLSHVAVWNTTMPEHNYLVRRWGQFLAA